MYLQNDLRDQNLELFPFDSTEAVMLLEKSLGEQPNFIPLGYKCGGCGLDLVQYFVETGISKGTGCPKCCNSFVC